MNIIIIRAIAASKQRILSKLIPNPPSFSAERKILIEFHLIMNI